MYPPIPPLLSLTIISLALAVTGLLRRPGLGIILALLLIAYNLLSGRPTPAQLGLSPTGSWLATLLFGLLLGAAIALLATSLIDPVAENLTGRPHDISIVAGIQGDPKVLVQWLLTVWIFVALLEELLFRGYLMTQLALLLPASLWGLAANLLISSLIFGLAHAYQGPSGVVSAGLIGLLIGIVFLASGFNLWLAILIHACIDTFQLTLLYAGRYDAFKHALIKPAD
jgi:membrane protease YdiL (CAAX protease family)